MPEIRIEVTDDQLSRFQSAAEEEDLTVEALAIASLEWAWANSIAGLADARRRRREATAKRQAEREERIAELERQKAERKEYLEGQEAKLKQREAERQEEAAKFKEWIEDMTRSLAEIQELREQSPRVSLSDVLAKLESIEQRLSDMGK